MLRYTLLKNKLLNHLMRKGKKETSKRVFKNLLILLFKKKKFFLKSTIFRAIFFLLSSIEIKIHTRGRGKRFEVPYPVKKRRRIFLAIKKSMQISSRFDAFHKHYSETLLLTSRCQGSAIAQQKSTVKSALANRAIAHFRWF